MGVSFWATPAWSAPQPEQIFMHDPFGNLIELHQAGRCRCTAPAPGRGGEEEHRG